MSSMKDTVIQNIETKTLDIVTALSRNEFPVLIKTTGNAISVCDLRRPGSRRKFAILVSIMSKAHKLLLSNQTMNKRDLYYENTSLYGSQKYINDLIDELHLILQVPQGSLPFIASAKGLMAAGEKTKLIWKVTNSNGLTEEKIVSMNRNGGLVPKTFEIQSWGKLESNAKFILIIEKDAIFHRVIEEDILVKFEPFILLTGKGYPDMATRKLACKLYQDLQIPVFALVDGNPHGFEIAAIYKWGSYGQEQYIEGNKDLVVPNLILLGLLASEFEELTLPEDFLINFTEQDKRKLDSLIKRIQDLNNQEGLSVEPMWNAEVDIFKAQDKKAEIESMSSLGSCFITDTYLRSRINTLLNQSNSSQQSQQ